MRQQMGKSSRWTCLKPLADSAAGAGSAKPGRDE